MTNKKLTVETVPKISTVTRIKAATGPLVDRLFKAAAAVFFVATSYGYVLGWLRANQTQHDLATAGGIMVVSSALYLFVRAKQ